VTLAAQILVYVMGLQTCMGSWVWVGQVQVQVEFEAPMQNPYPHHRFQRVCGYGLNPNPYSFINKTQLLPAKHKTKTHIHIHNP